MCAVVVVGPKGDDSTMDCYDVVVANSNLCKAMVGVGCVATFNQVAVVDRG